MIVRWPTAAHALRHVVALYRSGTVVVGRPETSAGAGEGFLVFFGVFLRRLFAFFAFSAKGFSRAHAIAGTLYFVPLYAAALAGVVALLVRRAADPQPRETVAWIALLAVCCIWVSQALVIIDYDWRYRLPIMPPMLILAALGVARLSHHWRS
jgi:hypothetical protein